MSFRYSIAARLNANKSIALPSSWVNPSSCMHKRFLATRLRCKQNPRPLAQAWHLTTILKSLPIRNGHVRLGLLGRFRARHTTCSSTRLLFLDTMYSSSHFRNKATIAGLSPLYSYSKHSGRSISGSAFQALMGRISSCPNGAGSHCGAHCRVIHRQGLSANSTNVSIIFCVIPLSLFAVRAFFSAGRRNIRNNWTLSCHPRGRLLCIAWVLVLIAYANSTIYDLVFRITIVMTARIKLIVSRTNRH